jgi:hypothetical protein
MLPQTQAQQRLLAQALRAAQPRPDVFAQAIARDPSVQYSTVLPLGVQTTPDPAGSLLSQQRTVVAMPELVRGLIEGVAAPNQVRQGKMDPMTGAMLTAGAAPVGGLLARAPAGALGMNVFHGTPYRFAPEPDFPQGRPRLDKMGTGEGAQAYGPGFYSAEAEKVGRGYQEDLTKLKRRQTLNGQLLPTSGTYDAAKVAKDFNIPESDAAYIKEIVKHLDNSVREGDIDSFIADRKSQLDFYPDSDADPEMDELLKAIRSTYEQEIRVATKYKDAIKPSTGNLYKFDIPDADAAKLLDYDAPISQQPKVVQDAIAKLGFMPDNPDKVAGGDVWYRMRRQLGEDEAAAAMRDAGVPGLRYNDAGSRGTDSAGGTRNFVIWDQDVLDRTQMLQRNDEVFENKITPQQMRDLLADPFGA